jgi:hypothetical protein
MPRELTELENQLRNLSHDSQAIEIIQEFAKKIGKTKDRQNIFNKKAAIVREPIDFADVLALGLIDSGEDNFIMLQGDIIATDSAYFLGERLTGMKFAIASSTCDLVPDRRKFANLLRIEPICASDSNAKQLISELLTFKSTKKMYLPRLPNDREDVVANAINFDGIVQVRLEDLLLATRYASLSLVGWRIFGSLLRTIMVRAGENEVRMRMNCDDSK